VVTALVRYLLADLLRGQRYLPVLVLFGAALAILYGGDPGDPVSAYAGSCVVIYPVSVWLAVVVAGAEDPVQRTVTATTTGGWARLHTGVTLLAALGSALLALLATAWPLVTSAHHYSWAALGTGLGGHLVCGWTGTAVGLALSRPVITRIGVTVLATLAVVAPTYRLGRHTPVGAVLALLSDRDTAHAPQVLAVWGAVAVALLAATTWLATRVAARR
jgi:hypothetical protein